MAKEKTTVNEAKPFLIKELTFTKEEWKKSPFSHDPDAHYWESQGKPVVWVEEYNKDGVVAYSDVGYGRLKLVVNGEVVESYQGHACLNGEYVLLSPYYGDEYEGKVFKMLNPNKPKIQTYVGKFWMKNPTTIKDIIHKLTGSFDHKHIGEDNYEAFIDGKSVVVHVSWDFQGTPTKVKVYCEDPGMETNLAIKMLTFAK